MGDLMVMYLFSAAGAGAGGAVACGAAAGGDKGAGAYCGCAMYCTGASFLLAALMVILKSFCSISTSLTPLLATNLIRSWIWVMFMGAWNRFRPRRAKVEKTVVQDP